MKWFLIDDDDDDDIGFELDQHTTLNLGTLYKFTDHNMQTGRSNRPHYPDFNPSSPCLFVYAT